MRRLIVTADDFGAAREVNDAVEAAHRGGVLSAASLMVSGLAAEDAMARAKRMPSLRVGLHLVLIGGRPVLPTSAVSHLVGADGQFHSNPVIYGAAIAGRARVRRELAAEIAAQFAVFRDSGLSLDHCNAHHHYHLHPVVGQLLAVIGRRFGLRAVRVPLEPTRILRRAERRTAPALNLLTVPFALALRRRLRAAGLLTPERVFGLRWSGHMTGERLAGLIQNLPDGLSEIYLHPATGPFPGAAKGYRYREELEALRAPQVLAACRGPALKLGGYSDFLDSSATQTCPVGVSS